MNCLKVDFFNTNFLYWKLFYNQILYYLLAGKKATYEGTVRNYFVDFRPTDLRDRIGMIETNIKSSGEKLVVRKWIS